MIRHEILENESIFLESPHLELAEEIIQQNPELPISLEGNSLSFNDYIVGEMQLADLLITIKPRNKALNLGTIFEMAAFVNINTLISNLNIPGYNYNQSFGISAITDNFYKIVQLLLQYGLTGNLIGRIESSKLIKGKMLFDNFNFKTIPYKGIETISHNYTLNIEANQVIKSALIKLLQIEKSSIVTSQIFSLLRDFDQIDEYKKDSIYLDEIVRQHSSSNPYYPLALEYALLIIKDLKLELRGGNVDWYAFLENSNTLFEKYIFKVLNTGLSEKVEKWDVPKQYATIRYNNSEGFKYFSPDIILDYNHRSNSCRAILDVKNKSFHPSESSLSDLVEPSDIYQIVFYCKRLNTNTGGLIFPSSNRYDPIQLMVDSENDLYLYLISVNMNDSFEFRYQKLISDVKRLFVYS